jgi:hypothetical protein
MANVVTIPLLTVPFSKKASDRWGGVAVTMLDSLDTMQLMGHNAMFDRTVAWLAEHLPAKLKQDVDVNFFEASAAAPTHPLSWVGFPIRQSCA